MKQISLKKTIILGTIIAVTGFAAFAFAHGNRYDTGRGYHMGGGYGMNGNSHMGGGSRMMGHASYDGQMMGYGGRHMWDDLSVEERREMQEQMDIFYNATRQTRQQYYDKRLELNREYAKTQQDDTKIQTLRKELFDLSSQLEKERFEHMTKMEKLFAGKAGGFSRGGGYGGCFY